jgi:hypothetical protein
MSPVRRTTWDILLTSSPQRLSLSVLLSMRASLPFRFLPASIPSYWLPPPLIPRPPQLSSSRLSSSFCRWSCTHDVRLSTPSAGLPPLLDWVHHARDIVSNGYEAAREPIEVISTVDPEVTITNASLKLVKGFTRATILAWAIMKLQTFDAGTMSESDQNRLRAFGLLLLL